MENKQNYRMINIGEKKVTRRRAVATGTIKVSKKTMEYIRKGQSPKGDILSLAEVAGIMAAKNTSQILPLCHPLLLDSVRIWFQINEADIICFCEVECESKTGVEMEALTGLNVTLLAIYDLAKAIDPVIEIKDVYLELKEGGKSGRWQHPRTIGEKKETSPKQDALKGIRVSVGTLSDRASSGAYEDVSGNILIQFCLKNEANKGTYKILPDEEKDIKEFIISESEKGTDLLLLTGSTGISSRDIAPEVVSKLACKEILGFGEAQRQLGARFTSTAWLSRSSAYRVRQMLVVLFPGSPRAVQQGLNAVGDIIPHAIKMIRNENHEEGRA